MSLADVKARMGHDSVRAAMIYQHAAAEADQKIANALEQRIGTISRAGRPALEVIFSPVQAARERVIWAWLPTTSLPMAPRRISMTPRRISRCP